MKKWIVLLLVAAMAISLAACDLLGGQTSGDAASLTDKELNEKMDEKMTAINDILEGNADLWNRLFTNADTAPDQTDDGESYSQSLSEWVEANQNLFSAEELKALEQDMEKMKEMEAELAALEEEYEKRGGTEETSTQKFPDFEGQTFDGERVDSSLFKDNAVTVVNFWFNGCQACVAELKKLDELNEALKEKGGAVIGINTDTFDGNEKVVAEAKEILEKKGAAYTNLWVDSDSDLAALIRGFTGFPITYVVDRSGNVAGEPVLGGIDNAAVMELLQEQIETAVLRDSLDDSGSTGSVK